MRAHAHVWCGEREGTQRAKVLWGDETRSLLLLLEAGCGSGLCPARLDGGAWPGCGRWVVGVMDDVGARGGDCREEGGGGGEEWKAAHKQQPPPPS